MSNQTNNVAKVVNLTKLNTFLSKHKVVGGEGQYPHIRPSVSLTVHLIFQMILYQTS